MDGELQPLIGAARPGRWTYGHRRFQLSFGSGCLLVLLAMASSAAAGPAEFPAPGDGRAPQPVVADGAPTRARYLVLTAQNRQPPDFKSVDIVVGPRERWDGRLNGVWWQVEVRTGADQQETPLFIVRALTEQSPFEDRATTPTFHRYQLRLPETGETLEYRDVHRTRSTRCTAVWSAAGNSTSASTTAARSAVIAGWSGFRMIDR